MQTPRQDNPFSLVYDAVCAVIEARGVRVASWNKTREPPIKDVLAEGDFPEIQLRVSTASVDVGGSSRDIIVARVHEIVVNTGDMRLGHLLFPTEWKLLGAAYDLKYGDKLNGIEFKGRSLVTDVNVNGTVVGLSDPTAQNNRGIAGWTALWSVNVIMHLDKDDL